MKFSPGNVYATPGALTTLSAEDSRKLLKRHLSGDWGDLDHEDKRANETALQTGARLLSAYQVNDQRIWIITEADRSSTTMLLPEEY